MRWAPTTQYLEEADELADRIALLDNGRLVAEGTPAELKRMVPGGRVSLRFTDPERLAAAARVFPGSTRDDDAFTLQVASDGIEADELTVHTPDLDDVFLSLTGRPAEQQKEPAR